MKNQIEREIGRCEFQIETLTKYLQGYMNHLQMYIDDKDFSNVIRCSEEIRKTAEEIKRYEAKKQAFEICIAKMGE